MSQQVEYKKVHYITAGAGAGKTTSLVNIITDLVKNGADPERMILTTFTEAAATEFREKSKAGLPAEKAVRMNAAKIGTLHSIASAYINRYWYQLGVSPAVKPMNKALSDIMMNRSLENVINATETAFLNGYAETFIIMKKGERKGIDYDYWKGLMKSLFDAMRRYDFDKSRLTGFRDKTLALLKNTFTTDGNAALVKSCRSVLEEYLSYSDVVENLATKAKKEPFKQKCKVVKYFLDTDPALFEVKGLKAAKEMSWKNCPVIEKKGPDKDKYDPLLEASHNATGQAVLYLATHLVPKEVMDIHEVTKLIFRNMGEWMDAYTALKNQHGIIDFADMEDRFWQLLQRDEVKEDIRNSIDYLFVDEFQDSSPIQAKIYGALSGLIKQSWFVGDRKQAIYGFAGSDAALIGELSKQFPKPDPDPDSFTGYKKNGDENSSQILDTSYRSVPRLVDAANRIFVPAFGVTDPDCPLDTVPKEEIELLPKPGNADTTWESLYHFSLQGKSSAARTNALATALCRMMEDKRFKEAGYTPSDIAVLARTAYQVKDIVNALRKKDIVTAAIDPSLFKETPEVSLILAILKLSDGIDKEKSCAEIRKLLAQEDLDQLAVRIRDKQNKLDDYPGLESFAEDLRKLSVADRIDEIVARLDIYGVCGLWESPKARRLNIQLLRTAAEDYLGQSAMLCWPADVRGFLSFLASFQPDPPFDNSAEGVKVLTYHKSKGLQWKIVVLFGLDKYEDEKNISGISIEGARSAPDGLLCIPPLPEEDWVEDCIQAQPDAAKLLREKRATKKWEEKRLLYVGFTRAKDVVITAGEQLGVIDALCPTAASRVATDPNHLDIWGIGRMSAYSVEEDDPAVTASPSAAFRYKDAGFFLPAGPKQRFTPKYLSPSLYKKPGIQASPEIVKDFGHRTDVKHNLLDDNAYGDVVHHIFAGCRPGQDEANRAVAERTLRAFAVIEPDGADKLAGCIGELFGYLEEQFPGGEPEQELPFRYADEAGQVFTGNMDLVWRTPEGSVLVDYKTFPGSRDELFNADGDHWAGKYASQLDVYARALEARDGRAPLACWLYYPVQGLIVNLK